MKSFFELIDDKHNIKSRSLKFTILIVIAIVILTSVYRSFFGFDWSDEGYYATSAYRFAIGDKIFVDSWDIHQTSSILISPIVWLYIKIVGSTSGIILFLRILYLLLKLTLGLFVYKTIKKSVNEGSAIIAALTCYVFTPFNIGTISYNTLSLIFNLFAVCSVLNVLYSKTEKVKLSYSFMAGIFLSLCIISYPTYLICIPIFLILLIYCSSILKYTNKKKLRTIGLFILGMLLIAVVFVGYMQLKVGFKDLFRNIPYVFGEEDHAKQPILIQIAGYFKELYKYISYKKILLFIFMVLLSLNKFIRIEKSVLSKFLNLVLLMAIIITNVLQYISGGESSYRTHIFILGIGMWTLLIMVLSAKSEILPVMIVWWLPSFFGSLAIYLGTNNGLRGAAYSFIGCTVAGLLPSFYSINNEIRIERLINFTGVIQGVLIIVILLTANFNFVYRDSHIKYLNSTLNVGPYRFINTTGDKAEIYEKLYYDLREAANNQEYAAIVQCIPYAYMCIDSKISAHTVWWIHPDSARFTSYIQNNEDRKPSLIIKINENVGIHNDSAPAKDSYLMNYIDCNMTVKRDYKYFTAYYRK